MRKITSVVAFLAGCTLAVTPVSAVVTSGGETASSASWDSGSITAWDHVGSIGIASGVYLGNYGGEHWVITAAHVDGGSFSLNGYTYGIQTSVGIAKNPEDGSYNLDLVLHRIDSSDTGALGYLDSLGTLAIGTSDLGVGTDVRLIGYGGEKSWGDNVIAGQIEYPMTQQNGAWGGHAYYTYDADGVEVVVGDSGGGLFYHNGDEWVLAGILSAKSEEQQLALAINLAAYSDQILAAIPGLNVIPEPAAWASMAGMISLLVAANRRSRVR